MYDMPSGDLTTQVGLGAGNKSCSLNLGVCAHGWK